MKPESDTGWKIPFNFLDLTWYSWFWFSYLVLLVLEHNRKGEVGVVELLEGAVDQGLVQVEDEGELGARPGLEGQRRMPAPHLGGQRGQVLDEEVRVKLLPVLRLRFRLRRIDLHLRVKLIGLICLVLLGMEEIVFP